MLGDVRKSVSENFQNVHDLHVDYDDSSKLMLQLASAKCIKNSILYSKSFSFASQLDEFLVEENICVFP